jgi:hypothetical protein
LWCAEVDDAAITCENQTHLGHGLCAANGGSESQLNLGGRERDRLAVSRGRGIDGIVPSGMSGSGAEDKGTKESKEEGEEATHGLRKR